VKAPCAAVDCEPDVLGLIGQSKPAPLSLTFLYSRAIALTRAPINTRRARGLRPPVARSMRREADRLQSKKPTAPLHTSLNSIGEALISDSLVVTPTRFFQLIEKIFVLRSASNL
jgi:hypothetical protein